MGPRVDLVLYGSGQLTGSQKTHFAVSPVNLEGPSVDQVNYEHFHKYLAGGESCSVVGRSGLLAGLPGILGSVP